ncbi:endonuclease MutS2 [Prochlorococcus sp. MIT 1223]|uniref:endonuclease MutS2 n=1 Tax=Prochlorococcus sp. MIT 1223 TaxID=3096217 RepID=UPI002A758F0B|nr:endonuclease MutS2 [Prochlorococcus sp. MIT 1223]
MNEQLKNISHNSIGEAFHESLELLEWPRLCAHLATFASTPQGEIQCKNLLIPQHVSITRRYLDETLEIGALDELIEGGISFYGIYDLNNILRICEKGGVVSGEDLLKVASTLRATRQLRRQIDDPEVRPSLSLLLENLSTLPELEKLLQFGLEEGGRVADRASQKLTMTRRQLEDLRKERKEKLLDLLRKNNSIIQDTIISERFGRPVLALKLGATDQIAGIIHDTSSSGNTIFVEPQSVISLGNRISQVESVAFQEEQRLLALWSKEVGKNFLKLDYLSGVILKLDLALSRARYGSWLGGVPPSIKDDQDNSFSIQNFRHPLLLWQQVYEGGDKVVPISFEIDSTLRVVAITGPNTGGKTAALKSFGLAILMTRFGLLLPCIGTPSIPWCNQVLADIGDEQSLQQNLSTFSGHLVRISKILDDIATLPGPAIVLLDEIGAGTDPTEGTSIAIALLKVLADRARLTIATTHFGELKALKYNDPRFENASVAFDSETTQPTYNLQWGIPGRSNALAIASRLGLDQLVIDNAQKLIGSKGINDVNEVIKGLEKERERQQVAAEDAARLLARTELLHEELLGNWKKQQKKSDDFQERGRHKLEMSIREGQKEVRQLIHRLRDAGANGEIARTTGKRLRELQSKNHPKHMKKNVQIWFPKKGDRVRLIALGKAGEIIHISDDGLQLTVICGVFRSTVDLSDVESIDGLKPTIPKPEVHLKIKSSARKGAVLRNKQNTLDVRGLRVHEAEAVIDEKIRNVDGPIWIIHGIGTGKLKRGLRVWLETLSYVERVEDASQSEGGAGCSVIWLR